MSDERAYLERKSKEELIEELLERRGELDRLETELTAIKAIEGSTDAEADKYALQSAQSDMLVYWMICNGKFEAIPAELKIKIDLSSTRHMNRTAAYAEREAKKSKKH